MLRDIILHGALGAEFGERFRLDVATPAEAVRALILQVKGFRSRIRGGSYRVIKAPARELGERELALRLGRANELHIVPVPAGAASGLGKIIAGVALVAAAFAAPYLAPTLFAGTGALAGALGTTGLTITGVTASIGFSLALGGVAAMLAPSPKGNPNQNASFLFGGQLNITGQGGPVPLLYGTFLTGSVVISAGLEIQQLLGGGQNLFGDGSLETGH